MKKLGAILWSITKTLFRLLGKILLFAFWVGCELLANVFAAIARFLKEKITAKR